MPRRRHRASVLNNHVTLSSILDIRLLLKTSPLVKSSEHAEMNGGNQEHEESEPCQDAECTIGQWNPTYPIISHFSSRETPVRGQRCGVEHRWTFKVERRIRCLFPSSPAPYMRLASMPSEGVPFLGQYTIERTSQRLSRIIPSSSNHGASAKPNEGQIRSVTCGTSAPHTI